MICPHGVEHATAVEAVEVEYKREQATGEPRSAWLCGCCMTPSGDAQWCPSCLVEVSE